jgi:hypothetical protein
MFSDKMKKTLLFLLLSGSLLACDRESNPVEVQAQKDTLAVLPPPPLFDYAPDKTGAAYTDTIFVRPYKK